MDGDTLETRYFNEVSFRGSSVLWELTAGDMAQTFRIRGFPGDLRDEWQLVSGKGSKGPTPGKPNSICKASEEEDMLS